MNNYFLVLCFLLGFFPSNAKAIPAASLDDIPLVGRYKISATIGEDQIQYHALQKEHNHTFRNQNQGFTAIIDDSGLQVINNSHPFILNLAQYGYGEALSVAPEATPHVQKNRIELQRDLITEWYINGPFGLQQGFTLARPPHQSNRKLDMELHLTLTMEGLDGIASQDGENMDLVDPSGKTVMQYSGLTAFDANGIELPARLATTKNTLHIYVDDRTASYPVVIDPIFQKSRLTMDPDANDEQEMNLGFSVAINGGTVVLGAPGYHDPDGGINRGAVYVYSKPSTGWADMSQTARLIASDGAGGHLFGKAVAIDESGSVIVVGAPGHDSDKGQAYLFLKPTNSIEGVTWVDRVEDAVLTNFSTLGVSGDLLGRSVDISGDTVVVGAPGRSTARGAAYVFVRPAFPGYWESQGSYEPSAILLPSPDTNQYCGISVAIHGNRIIAGAPKSDGDKGAAYLFIQPTGTDWLSTTTFNLKLVAGDGAANDNLGNDVAINGSIFAAGAPNHGTSGAVYLFDAPGVYITGSSRFHTTKLLPQSAVTGAAFGSAIAMNDTTVVVGTPYQAVGGRMAQGQLFLFFKPGSTWPGTTIAPVEMTEDILLTSSDGAISDYLGWGVAIDSNNTLVTDFHGTERAPNFFQY